MLAELALFVEDQYTFVESFQQTCMGLNCQEHVFDCCVQHCETRTLIHANVVHIIKEYEWIVADSCLFIGE